jgi:hypothetical protein
MFLLPQAAAARGIDPNGVSTAIHGFGNVGRYAAVAAEQMGAKVVAVSDISGGIYNPEGINVAAVEKWVDEQRFLEGFPDADFIEDGEVFELPVDVLVPAAIQGVLTGKNAGNVSEGTTRVEPAISGARIPADHPHRPNDDHGSRNGGETRSRHRLDRGNRPRNGVRLPRGTPSSSGKCPMWTSWSTTWASSSPSRSRKFRTRNGSGSSRPPSWAGSGQGDSMNRVDLPAVR